MIVCKLILLRVVGGGINNYWGEKDYVSLASRFDQRRKVAIHLPSSLCHPQKANEWMTEAKHRLQQQHHDPRCKKKKSHVNDDRTFLKTQYRTHLMPHTIKDCPRRQSPAANTPSTLVEYFCIIISNLYITCVIKTVSIPCPESGC
jgi:hypothetical protein